MKRLAAILAVVAIAGTATAEGHTGEKGFVPARELNPVVEHHVHPVAKHPHHVRTRLPVEFVAVPTCPPRFNGMFRGTLYCINGKPLK